MPIVFTLTPDPVGAGLVASLARPGGNATGFSEFEYGISAKWLELLKQIAPSVTRAAVLRDAKHMADASEILFELWIDRVIHTTWENVLTPQMRSVHRKWRARAGSGHP